MKDLLKEIIQFMLKDGEIDAPEEINDAIFWLSNCVESANSKWDREFKDKFFGDSLYLEHGFGSVEEVTIISLDDEHIKLYAFDDSYEGHEIVLIANNEKLELKSSRKVDETETNCFGLEDEELIEILEK